MPPELLLGDEAVARAAVDAGVGAAYGYPGTPSTEILESLIRWNEEPQAYVAGWCTNEKTAFEQALGASMAGRRALVTMKHVGLNVAADPFVNSVMLGVTAGLVLVVADDPGMHSSQNEQDSRFYADFARTVCLEPSNQQDAYEMTLDAFSLSEEIGRPVVVRIVTRIAHSRALVRPHGRAAAAVPAGPARRAGGEWTLLPSHSRRLWRSVVEASAALVGSRAARRYNTIVADEPDAELAVVTAGIAGNYYAEVADELPTAPWHAHVGHYPIDPALLAAMPRSVRRVVVLEDGYPVVERWLRGRLDASDGGAPPAILGRESGSLPATGELTPDVVRAGFGLPPLANLVPGMRLPARPPQLCSGCPHADSFRMISSAIAGAGASLVTSDIGCYSLGALPPHSLLDSIVCMGASIGMAKGAAEAGHPNVVAVIGDSTFLHSGIPSLLDAARENTPITVIILDNETVAMTGGQPTAAASDRLEQIVRAVGVAADHVVTLNPLRAAAEENARAVAAELDHEGVSVIIARRACVKTASVRRREVG